MDIQVAEIFESLSGEVGGFVQGSPTTFIRLAGCSLKCPWCDTQQWQNPESGDKRDTREVALTASEFPWKQILITGGEPLEQISAVEDLIKWLRKEILDCKIQIETNGTISINQYWLADYWVVDYKGQDAMGEVPYYFNQGSVLPRIWIKYLIGSLDDLHDAISLASTVWKSVASFSISPITDKVSRQEVLEAILTSGIPIILNVQLHKIIGVR